MTLTPFEASGYEELTSLADEHTFYDTLAGTGRIEVTVLGPASPPRDDRVVRHISVVLPETPQDAPNILFTGLQHGNEVMGREALLGLIRDLAETTDENLLGLMRRCRFHFMPTVNPTGFPTQRFIYGQPTDINREHLSLKYVENLYIHQSITALEPVAVIDCHEYFSPGTHRLGLEYLPALTPMGDPSVDNATRNLLSHIQGRLTSEQIPHQYYAPAHDEPELLQNWAYMRGSMGLLIETPAWEDLVSYEERYRYFNVSLDAVKEWFNQNLETAARIVNAGRTNYHYRIDRFDLTNGNVLDPTPGGYTLPSPAPSQFEVFGIEYSEDDGTVTVSMNQPGRRMIPYLLDPDAPSPVAQGSRLPPPRGEPVKLQDAPAIRVKSGGETYLVSEIRTQYYGRVVKLWPDT